MSADPDNSAAFLAADLHVQATYRLTEALVASEKKMRRRIELLIEIIFETDAGGKIIFLNQAWTVALGYPTAACVRRPLAEFVCSEDRKAFEGIMAGEGPPRGGRRPRIRFLNSSGAIAWMELSVSQLAEGGVVGALHDATKMKVAEDELTKLSLVASYTANPVIITDGAGRVEWVNKAFTKLTGYALEEMIGRKPGELLQGPETDPAVVMQIRELLLSGEPFEAELVNYSRSGASYWLWLKISPIHDGEGRVQRFVSVQSDISERKKAEEQLRQLEREQARQVALFQTSLDTLTDCVLITDLAGEPYYWNRHALALYGYRSLAEVPRRSQDFDDPCELVHDDGRLVGLEMGPLARALRGEIVSDWECRVRHKRAGWVRSFVFSANLARDGGGQPILAVVGMVETTVRRELERQLRQSQKMEAIGQLASGIAHDVNNLLAPILMGADILLRRRREQGEQPILTMIKREAQRGGAVINQLLAFTRGIEGQRTVVRTDLLLMEIVGMIRETFPRELRIESSISAAPWSIFADPTQVHQVFLNLCVNARDAMPAGGRLGISLTNVEITAAESAGVATEKPGAYVVTEIRDTGEGISSEIIHRIFDPFFTTKPVGKGTGLGLSTVLGIVRAHGGFVKVDSTPGIGSVFRVFWPATQAAVDGGAVDPVVSAETFGARHILVVDDEASIRDVTGSALTLSGYRVSLAENGNDALAIFREYATTIDLVLTDIMMPLMNGTALIKAVRAQRATVPIIGCSGFGKPSDFEELRIQGFLLKPYTMIAMLDMIEQQFTKSLVVTSVGGVVE